jgi:hypothetical protein
MDYTKEIIETLIENTKSNIIDWIPCQNLFSSDTKHHFKYHSEDGKTKFQIEIQIEVKSSTIKNGSCLTIRNDNIIDKCIFIHGYGNTQVLKLAELIFNSKIKPTLLIKNQDLVFDDILNSLGTKSSRRDKKIDEILGIKPFWKKFIS